jgi:beta-galactosidase
MNLYFGWYYRTLEGFGPFLDSLHARHPTRPLLISEYGAGSDERIHTTAPVAFDFSAEHQQRFHESNFSQLLARPYIIGTAVWNQFDFGSKGRHDSKPNVNQKGLLYYDRSPKDIWYYYRSLMLEEPVLHIASRDWPRRAGSSAEDMRQPVIVYTNVPHVELFVNGTSVGVQRPDNATIRWIVPLRAGTNTLEARGPNGERDEFMVHYDDRAPFFGDAASSVRDFAVNTGAHYAFIDPDGLAGGGGAGSRRAPAAQGVASRSARPGKDARAAWRRRRRSIGAGLQDLSSAAYGEAVGRAGMARFRQRW